MADDRYRYRSRHSAGTWFCAAYQYDHEQEVAVFFLLGFLLSAYMGISTVGIVCFSVVIVGILLIVKDFVPNQPALQEE